MSNQQSTALHQIGRAILETIRESPDGAPSGHLYAAVMTVGVSLEQYEQIMLGLVNARLVYKRWDCYFSTPEQAKRGF